MSNVYEILAENLEITYHLGGSGVDIENDLKPNIT
jgi:hypothetical protein